LVLLLHLLLLQWLNTSESKLTEAKPLEMAVEMVSISRPKTTPAPPKPTPPPEKKPEPKKQPPKPIVRKPPPIQQQAPDFAPVQTYTPPPPTTSTSSAAASESTAKAAPAESTYTEANFRANYLHNPKPEYPALARSRSWTGKVLLRVQVTAEGECGSVSVHQSSGHEVLDDAALDAVKQWRFVPAKRGETPVASSVIVPINFNLE
jgi:periplasmic protein TonB